MREMAPLYVEVLQALTPHLHWIAAAQRCSLWRVAKRSDMWLNRAFDTAENYRVINTLPRFLEALGEMPPNTWRLCLHVSTSPVPRAVGEVDDASLNKGLGSMGQFPLPHDPSDSVVPEFYKDGLQGFNPLQGGQRGPGVSMRLPAVQVDEVTTAYCMDLFIHEADRGPRITLGFPLLTTYGFALLPSSKNLVYEDSLQACVPHVPLHPVCNYEVMFLGKYRKKR